MSKYCKLKLKGVSSNQMGNYKVTKGIDGKGQVVEPDVGILGGVFKLDEGVYLCQYNGLAKMGQKADQVDFQKETEYCPIEKMFTVGPKDLGKSKSLVIPKIKMDHVEAEGMQPIYLYSDQLEENFYDNEDENLARLDGYGQLGNFKDIAFDTPAWKGEKTINQFTTNQERWEFLEGFLGNENYYLYSYKFPVVIFSREGLGGQDLFGDLAILKDSCKLNFLYQAQVHGNEYAAGEGALGVIEKLIEDDSCLESLNIVIIPCVNQLGNTKSTRDCGKININRDFLKCQAQETEKLHDIFFGFLPELVVDAHTFTRRNSFIEGSLKRAMFDVRISGASTTNIDEQIHSINQEIVKTVIDDVNGKGLRAGYYSNSVNCNLGRLYYNLLGGCSILFESEGTRSGKFHFKRNVAGQVKGILSIMAFACREKDRIKGAVTENRKRFYDGSNIHRNYTFNHNSSGENDQVVTVAEYDPFGRLVNQQATTVYKRYDQPVRLVEIPESLTFELAWFEGEMEDLFKKNHVVFKKTQDGVLVDMNQITQFVIIELLRDTDGEL